MGFERMPTYFDTPYIKNLITRFGDYVYNKDYLICIKVLSNKLFRANSC